MLIETVRCRFADFGSIGDCRVVRNRAAIATVTGARDRTSTLWQRLCWQGNPFQVNSILGAISARTRSRSIDNQYSKPFDGSRHRTDCYTG